MLRASIAVAILFALCCVAFATTNREYGADEYGTVVGGDSPNGRYTIATHGEGCLGYTNFHLYLIDQKSRNPICALSEPAEPCVDTGADAYDADWFPDSRRVSITFRTERRVAVEVTYVIQDGRPFQIGGRQRVDLALTAQDHAAAAQMFEQLISALGKGDYDAFIRLGDANFRERITREKFENVYRQLAPRFKQGSQNHYVTDLGTRHGCDVSLWILSFRDSDDKFSCELSIKDGKAAGLLIQQTQMPNHAPELTATGPFFVMSYLFLARNLGYRRP
jgi:hypothetical protein